MPTTLEEKVAQCLAAANLTMPQLAAKLAWPEPALRARCHHGDPRLFELVQLAQALHVPPAYFLPTVTQGGAFNQNGNGNIQKIKIGKAAARQLAAQLSICRNALEGANQLVAAKEEIINLLRGGYTRPN